RQYGTVQLFLLIFAAAPTDTANFAHETFQFATPIFYLTPAWDTGSGSCLLFHFDFQFVITVL
ncbi:MAG: hypothetical protein FWF98_01040, partial [Dehalococcoidia bacterium]|nr:hypothetical protein [Dehalococcoidia bacterium]